jgi:four helix bundle protein
MLDQKIVENDIYKLSKAFALRIVKLSTYLNERHQYIIAKQIFRSGTSIGANVHEAKYAQSKADFVSKLNIALKETSETNYWLDLLNEANMISAEQYDSINDDCNRILAVLIKIIKSIKEKES